MLINTLQKHKLNKVWFYTLSFTWGLPITLIGCIYALIFAITNHKPKRFGYCLYFESKKLSGGFNVGPFIFVCSSPSRSLLAHEHGHALQNCFYGPFMAVLVAMPSCVRYHYRRFVRRCLKKPLKNPYDSIWFENEATVIGKALCSGFIDETTV